ncbi:hypothetical protein [Streptomyces sp. NPDC005732]|uniref:hypothetical protein n=1 Tax=Streptomyces sp. NPDC005732 TaxID=3157057 RepID=UPI00340A7BF7
MAAGVGLGAGAARERADRLRAGIGGAVPPDLKPALAGRVLAVLGPASPLLAALDRADLLASLRDASVLVQGAAAYTAAALLDDPAAGRTGETVYPRELAALVAAVAEGRTLTQSVVLSV